MNAEDALKYAYAQLRDTSDWTCDAIAGSLCDHGGHEDELDAISDCVDLVRELVGQFGDPNRYSDGRFVTSRKEVDADSGLVTRHVWHPNSYVEQAESWRGQLPASDPDSNSPGVYEVSTNPGTQEIHVRVVRIAGGAA
jgi:hypothetical protein